MTEVIEARTDGELLATIDTCLGALTEDRLRLSAEAEQLKLILASLRLSARLQAWQQRQLAELERSQASWRVYGASTTTWLAEAGNLTPNQARHLIKAGQQLERFETVGEAATKGEVLPQQAEAMTTVLAELPREFPTEVMQEAQGLLVGFATDHNSSELRRLTTHLIEVLDPETCEAREERRLERQLQRATSRRGLEFRQDGDGSVLIRGSLPIVQAEPLIQIIDAYSAAERRALDALDPHAPLLSPAMRRADALVAMVNRHCQEALAPGNGGDRPRVVATLSYDRLIDQACAAGICDDKLAATLGEFTSGVALGGAAAGTGGVGLGSRLIRNGLPVPASELRRLLCDAEVLPVVLGGRSEILDVGRAQRLVTAPIRAALELRDQGCVFPGCDKPPQACQAHHLQPWWAGGSTSLANLVLVCPHHHGVVEPGHDPTDDRWRVEIGDDGVPQVLPPQRVDLHRTPRRHARFRIQVQ